MPANWELLFPGGQMVHEPGCDLRGGIGPAMKQAEAKVDKSVKWESGTQGGGAI